MIVLGGWKFSTMGHGGAFVPIGCLNSLQQLCANTWTAEMVGKSQETSHMAEVLGPHGWTTLSVLSNTALSGNVSQTPGILIHVITEQKRHIFLALVIKNVSVQDCPDIYINLCMHIWHCSNCFMFVCYLIYITSGFMQMAQTFFFLYIPDMSMLKLHECH